MDLVELYGPQINLIKRGDEKYGYEVLVVPSKQKVTEIEYGLVLEHEAREAIREPDDDEVQRCVEFLNTAFKRTKFKEIKNRVLQKDDPLQKYLKISDYEGYDPQLVEAIIGANIFLFN